MAREIMDYAQRQRRFEKNLEFIRDNKAELKATYGDSAWVVVDSNTVIAASLDLDDLHEQVWDVPFDRRVTAWCKLDAPKTIEEAIQAA